MAYVSRNVPGRSVRTAKQHLHYCLPSRYSCGLRSSGMLRSVCSMFLDNVSVPSSNAKQSNECSWTAWRLKFETTGCTETSVDKYDHTLRNKPKERRPQQATTVLNWKVMEDRKQATSTHGEKCQLPKSMRKNWRTKRKRRTTRKMKRRTRRKSRLNVLKQGQSGIKSETHTDQNETNTRAVVCCNITTCGVAQSYRRFKGTCSRFLHNDGNFILDCMVSHTRRTSNRALN